MGKENPTPLMHSGARPLAALSIIALIAAAALLRAASPPQELPALVVEEIPADSGAAGAGLKTGDRVLSYDGKSVHSPAALQAAEENTPGKDEIVLRVRRGEQLLTLAAPTGKLGIQVRPELPPAALTLYENGRAEQKAQRAGEAIDRLTAAAKAAQESGDASAAAWLHTQAGQLQEGQRRWKEAIGTYAGAWELLKDSSDLAAQSRALIALGRCNENLNDFPAAAQWYAQAERVDTSAGNELWTAADITNLGALAYYRGDLPAAQDHAARALVIRERLAPGSLHVAGSFNSLGTIAFRRGELARAEDYHGRALGIRERLAPDSLAVADSLNNLGVVAAQRGDLQKAHDHHSRALGIREKLAPGSLDAAASLTNLANNLSSRGDLAGAHDHYRRALSIQEQLAPNSLTVAAILGNLGIVAFDRGDLVSAQENYSRALAIQERLAPDSLALAQSLNNLGQVASARGELAVAQDYHTHALRIKERLAPNSVTVAASLTNLGNVANERGDRAAAHDYQTRALDIRQRLAPNSLETATSLNNLGNIARSRGDLDAADDYHTRALAIRERLAPNSLNVAMSLNNLGETSRSRGNLTAAQDYFRRSLEIKEREAPNSLNVAATLNSLGVVASSLSDSASALEYHSRAFSIRERLAPMSLAAAGSLNHLGRIALTQRRYSDSLPLFARAVDIVEAQRSQVRSTEARALLMAQHAESYTGLMRSQFALNDVRAAFTTAERARARSLLDLLTEAGAEIRQDVDHRLLDRERLLQQQLNAKADQQSRLLGGRYTEDQAAAVEKELDALLVQYQDFQAQLRSASPRYAALTQPHPLGVAEIQKELDEDSLLLEYALGEENSYLWAVTPSSIESFELPGRREIEGAARRVYELLTARQPRRGETMSQRQARIATADAGYPAAAAALSKMVMGPVAGLLRERRLLIAADGALLYVPFGALPEPGPASSDWVPLIVRHEIVTLPSASVVSLRRRELQGRQPAEKLIAVLADPVFDSLDPRLKRGGRDSSSPAAALPSEVERAVRSAGLINDRGFLSRLPFTRDEAAAIVAAAPPGQSTRAIDFKASRSTVTSGELSRYRIVHLATHGVLDTEHPELSGIVLSLVDEDGKPQNGFLRLHEVYNLNWPAELVVLSACQTGLGKEIKGEGLVGLTRGFMHAGAERVLASLWNVNDSVTAEFMKRFYQSLIGKSMTPAAALREAQVEMWKRRSSRSPYYWAAFVLQGEWK